MVMEADTIAKFAYTVSTDTSECLTRLNPEALRQLWGTWLDQARLPTTIKEAVRRDPPPSGVAPMQEHVELTAPIVGDALPQH